MKRLLLIATEISALPALGQNTLVIHQTDGPQFSSGFDGKPVITYTEVQYPLASLAKLHYQLREPNL